MIVGIMDVILIGREGEFEKGKSSSGMPRYMSEIYNRMKNRDLNLEKVEFRSLNKIGKKIPFLDNFYLYLQSYLKDFSKYKIIHNPDPSGHIIKTGQHKQSILVCTIHDLVPIYYPNYFQQSHLLYLLSCNLQMPQMYL